MDASTQCVIKLSSISEDEADSEIFIEKKPPDRFEFEEENDSDSAEFTVRDPFSSTESSIKSMCRICHGDESNVKSFIVPCNCSGTLRYVHQACLIKWLKTNGKLVMLHRCTQKAAFKEAFL